MPDIPPISHSQGTLVENAEKAFRRIAERKLRERGCPEEEIATSMQRLLSKPISLTLDSPDGN